MGKLLRVGITLLVVAIAVIAGSWVWNHYLYSPWTRDGRIRADIITIAPDVSGWVTQMNVQNNQVVNQGDPLFTIDDTRYQAAFAEARAKVAEKYSALELAVHRYQSQQGSSDSRATSEEDLETYRIDMESAKAGHELARAELEMARIDLQRTQVVAPADGTINNLHLRQGNYVDKGKAVLSQVKADSFYVTGYFEETKLQLVQVGQPARITLMGGDRKLTGTVVSIARGVADTNTTSNDQMLPEVQQAFNWVRLAQRIPVDIVLDSVPEDIHLSAGMTVSIYLDSE
ncbi:HlyD family secretion protein [Marinobacter vulgaris]|uniref:HlyD family secretion protein n=1 Tax=Marinobacter vulgaris TaxID=1928331 RepID=A0A2V3ZI08_9GAMM|nr:efflux RND transporter periplasmic adaptor subunit [Marinobacter vulgaris]PXX89611.1 HlyD family secretion protein [Marinobacter vulgaris]TSJ68599.1 efflux RND transporter periplasmic adaptor subunit [Marinobacter vulgaris]